MFPLGSEAEPGEEDAMAFEEENPLERSPFHYSAAAVKRTWQNWKLSLSYTHILSLTHTHTHMRQ